MLQTMTIKAWREEGRNELLSTPIFKVHSSLARSQLSGKEHEFVILDCPDWVNVVALTDEGQVVLIHQWRHGTQEITTEIPGGMVEEGESPEEAGRRELLEETGYEATHWEQIGVVEPNPAFQTNRTFTFLARGAKKVAEQSPDPNEEIAVEERALTDVPGLIAQGEIRHALVVCAFFFALFEGEPG